LRPLDILIFHQATGEALAHSITKRELENAKLKKRIRELEVALSLRPLIVDPFSLMVSHKLPKEVTGSSSKVTKVAKLLMSVKKYVV